MGVDFFSTPTAMSSRNTVSIFVLRRKRLGRQSHCFSSRFFFLAKCFLNIIEDGCTLQKRPVLIVPSASNLSTTSINVYRVTFGGFLPDCLEYSIQSSEDTDHLEHNLKFVWRTTRKKKNIEKRNAIDDFIQT